MLGIGGYWLYTRYANPLSEKEDPLPLLNSSTEPPKVTLRLGAAMSLEAAPECRGTDRAQVIKDGQGQIWVLLAQFETFQFSKWTEGGFTPLAPMPSVGHHGAEEFAVALTEGNLPIVFWQAFGEPGKVLIVSTQWSPQGWSSPVTLDTMPTPALTRSFDAIRDASGRVHLVYDRFLDPPEAYKRAPIVIDAVDVFRPGKAFHVYLEKGSWSRPAATTGAGKFDFRDFRLCLDPAGEVCLSGIVRLDDSSMGFIARQFWRNGNWTVPKRLTPTSKMWSCWVCFDLRRVTHIWSNCYQQLSNGRLEKMPLPFVIQSPIIRALPGGRIALLSEGTLTVWNGTEWCPTIYVGAEDMSVTPTGSILAWTWKEKTVHIREVEVKVEARSNSTQVPSEPVRMTPQ